MSCPLPITAWHLVIGGFRQHSERTNGMVRLWRRLNQKSSPATRVEFHTWNDKWSRVAETIWNLQGDGTYPPVIRIYAFSWGAGWGAMRLAKELGKRGLRVKWMVLSDPVYRASFFLSRCFALSSFARITVPGNVANVSWFRQRMNRPMGHDLVRDPGAVEFWKTRINEPVVLKRTHVYMDDAPEFHAECERVSEL